MKAIVSCLLFLSAVSCTTTNGEVIDDASSTVMIEASIVSKNNSASIKSSRIIEHSCIPATTIQFENLEALRSAGPIQSLRRELYVTDEDLNNILNFQNVNQSIVELQLDEGLFFKDPIVLPSLPSLQRLELFYYHQGSGERLVQSLEQLPSLKEVGVSRGVFEDHEFIRSLDGHGVKALRLSHSTVNNDVIDAIAKSQIQKLRLDSIAINEDGAAALNVNKKLQIELEINNKFFNSNELTGVVAIEFYGREGQEIKDWLASTRSRKQIQSVKLRTGNDHIEEILTQLSSYPALTEIAIEGGASSVKVVDSISKISSLKKLSLSGKPTEQIEATALVRMKSISRLEIHSMDVQLDGALIQDQGIRKISSFALYDVSNAYAVVQVIQEHKIADHLELHEVSLDVLFQKYPPDSLTANSHIYLRMRDEDDLVSLVEIERLLKRYPKVGSVSCAMNIHEFFQLKDAMETEKVSGMLCRKPLDP